MQANILPGINLNNIPFHSLYNNEKEIAGGFINGYFVPYGINNCTDKNCIFDKKEKYVYSLEISSKATSGKKGEFQQNIINNVFDKDYIYGHWSKEDQDFYPYGCDNIRRFVNAFSYTIKVNGVDVEKISLM